MRKVLLLGVIILQSIIVLAQENEPNLLRYYMKDKTTINIKIAELDRLQKVSNLGMNLIFNNGTPNRTIFFSNLDSVVFVYDASIVDPIVTPGGNANKNTDPRATSLEFPRLKGGDMNILSIHSTKDYGNTFSIEWDCTKKAQRWTVYQLHEGNKAKNVSRTDAWAEDPNIPSQYRSRNSDYKNSGFSRGHMCPSGDRLCSKEQNNQTFYFSNMHPQWQNHNGVLWECLETLVRNMNNRSFCDTLFVVKAGTIGEGQTLGTIGQGLPIPKYFYMALLSKKGNNYKAIAFWTLHENRQDKNTNYKDYAISIKELEQKTGIDFFCNLPDDIEKQVEESFNASDWGL